MKKILAMLLSAVMLMGLSACGEGKTDEKDPPENDDSSNEQTEEGTLNDLVKNFWQTETMYDETVMFIAETDDFGNVISAPRAKLLFEPKEILSVKQYFHESNANETVIFENGTDFTCQDGYLVASGTITDNPITDKKEFAGKIPYVTDKALTGEAPFPGLSSGTTIPSKEAGLYLPFTEGYQIVQMQLCVTYTHDVDESVELSYFGDGALSGVLSKLKAKESVELFVYGDSISTGANSSGYLNIPPYLKTWPELVADNLSRYFGTEVNLTNRAVGGWTSANGLSGGNGYVNGQLVYQAGLNSLFSDELKDYIPDLVFLGFGMNDASIGTPDISAYCNNMMSMIDILRRINPDCEIVLIGTMLANPMARDQSKNQTEYTQYLSRVAERYEGVCVVDVGSIHQSILDAGKCYTEISSNNVNHPNDFMARVYAVSLLSALINTANAE